MTELVYSTGLQIEGPWLLDADALAQLDDVLTDEWKRLQGWQEEILDEEAEAEIQRDREGGYYQGLPEAELLQKKKEVIERKGTRLSNRKEIRIHLLKSRSVLVDSFRDAFKEQALIEEVPIGFEIHIDCGKVRCRVSLDRRSGLSINASPEELSEARELFVVLRQWAMENRAPAWQRIWTRYHGIQWPIWYVILFLGTTVLDVTATEDAKLMARGLLDKGISAADVPKAIELLLILQTKYHPGQPGMQWPGWYKAIIVFGLIACVCLSIRPKSILGIGRGAERIAWWRRWLKFIGITIPTLIGGTLILPYVEDLIRRLFS